MSEFDELAAYMNAHTGTLSGGLDKDIEVAHAEAQEACRFARNSLSTHIDSERATLRKT